MRERRSHQALVVDEFGGTVGRRHAARTCCRSSSAKWATSSRPATPVAEPLPDGQVRLPGAMAVYDAAAALDDAAGRPTPPRSAGSSPRRSATAGAGRHGHRSTATQFQVERVADRAIESVLAHAASPPEEEARGMSELLVPLAIIAAAGRSPTRSSWPRSSPSSARRARNIDHHGGAGQPPGRARRAHPGRPAAAGPLHRHHADRHLGRQPRPGDVRRAACWRSRSSRGSRPSSHYRLVRQRTRSPASSPSACSPTSTSCSGEMVPKALALQSAQRTVAVRVARSSRRSRSRCCRSSSALNAAGNGLLALIGVKRQRERGRALSHQRGAAVHHRGEPGGRPAARRVGPHPARAVRVRQPDRGRGDGAARPPGRHPGRHRRWTSVQEIIRHAPHTRYPVYTGDLDHIVGSVHIKDAAAPPRRRHARRPAATRGRCRYVPTTDAARRGAGGDAPRTAPTWPW